MMKYMFITHVELVETTSEQFEPIFYCNYHARVDDLLEEFLVAQLADEEPPEPCQELTRAYTALSLVSRYNPHKKYKVSVIVFDDDQQEVVNDILQLVEEQNGPTIQMIRKSGDTQDL